MDIFRELSFHFWTTPLSFQIISQLIFFFIFVGRIFSIYSFKKFNLHSSHPSSQTKKTKQFYPNFSRLHCGSFFNQTSMGVCCKILFLLLLQNSLFLYSVVWNHFQLLPDFSSPCWPSLPVVILFHLLKKVFKCKNIHRLNHLDTKEPKENGKLPNLGPTVKQ